jgi:PASTA domain
VSRLMPRLLVLAAVWVLGTASITFAGSGGTPAPGPFGPSPKKKVALKRLVVPDVREQAYVVAKSVLEDAGFAWSVKGKVKGFAANRVIWQRPGPGARVLDTGGPPVVVRLARNKRYAERGLPENAAPYRTTRLVVVGPGGRQSIDPRPAAKQRPLLPQLPKQKPILPPKPQKPAKPAASQPAVADKPHVASTPADSSTELAAALTKHDAKATAKKETTRHAKHTAARQAAKAKTHATKNEKTTPKHEQDKKKVVSSALAAQPAHAKASKYRDADFDVPGAPREPRAEMPLPARARMLAKRLGGQPATPELIQFWRYQHNWLVYGARFGWKDGDDALRTLISIDRDLQRRWNMGYESEQEARAALRLVESRTSR